MDKEINIKEDLIWLCFINYIKTFEQNDLKPLNDYNQIKKYNEND